MSEDNMICPSCGTGKLHAEKRGWNAMWGFIGSGQIMLTCLNCGQKFKPGDVRLQRVAERHREYARQEDERTARMLTGDADRGSGRGAFATLPEFEIIGTNATGEKVRFRVNADDADGAKFIAAERDITVLGMRRVSSGSVPPSAPLWIVEGVDREGREHSHRVHADNRESAFAAGIDRGIVRANRIEPMQ